MLVLSRVLGYQRDSHPFSYRSFLLFTLALIWQHGTDGCFDSWYLLSPKAVSVAWERYGSPRFSVNSPLLVLVDLVLGREYLFSVPGTFRDVQRVMTSSQAYKFYRCYHTGVLTNKPT